MQMNVRPLMMVAMVVVVLMAPLKTAQVMEIVLLNHGLAMDGVMALISHMAMI